MNKKRPKSYDDDPVYYCTRCLSLKIKPIPDIKGENYCCDCGTTLVSKTTIDKWKEMYRNRYGKDYI
jgi:hypothetical protein